MRRVLRGQEMVTSVAKVSAAVLWVLIVAGCSDSGDGESDEPVADISGQWTNFQRLNAVDATLTGCTGDAAGFNGKTIAELAVAGGPTCTTNDPFLVDQTDAIFTIKEVFVSCDDGTSRTQDGGGVVTSLDTFEGTITTAYSQGVVADQFVSGTVLSDSSLLLFETHIEWSGVVNGQCDLNPPLATAVTVNVIVTTGGGPVASSLEWAPPPRGSADGLDPGPG